MAEWRIGAAIGKLDRLAQKGRGGSGDRVRGGALDPGIQKGWLAPAGWHGGLPPISLVAFAFFAIGYVINLFGRE